jgi:GTPase SAR1 family protein
MAELPTKEELEKLYHEKGHDALIWYAWRNALRALPALGCLSLQEIWKKGTVSYVYSVCRVSLILAQWAYCSAEASVALDTAATTAVVAARAATRGMADDAAYASAYAAAYSYASVFADSYTEAATYAASYAENYAATYVANHVVDTLACAYSYAYPNSEAAYTDADVIVSAAKADFFLLCQKSKFSWDSIPLWLEGEGVRVSKNIMYWQNSLLNNLQRYGLDFLAIDIENLWNGKPLGTHAKNYLKEYSETELNDPVALRRLILEGENAEYIHAVRVLILGPGGAGKSSLTDRLQGEKKIEYVKKITQGVNYFEHQALDLYKTFPYLQQRDKPLSLYLWDFGGQTIFHGLHSAFLHENCVYVLVVDSRHEQAPDEWLHQIRHLAGSQAKVLLVTNWYEQCETRQNETRLLREFPDLLDKESFFYFSCQTPQAPNFPTFVQALEQTSLASQRMVLKETLAIQEALKQRYQDGVFLNASDLEAVIEEITGTTDTESLEKMTEKLQQLGFLVSVDGDGQNYCLKPEWAVDHAYDLLYQPTLRDAKGLLELKTLQRALEAKIAREHTKYLVEFLQERSLCRKLRVGNGYFFPDAAPADEPAEATRLLANKMGLTIRFDLPYVPLGFHTKLVHRLFEPNNEACIREPVDIWRQGCILRKNDSCAVVHYLSRKSVIELVLVGKWQDFSALLNTLLVNLKTVLTSGKGMTESQIHPSVVLDQQVFSVHSAERLVAVLGQVTSRPQLIEEIKAMASTGNINVTNGQVIIGDHNTQKSHSDNTTITVTADQRQIISTVLDEMLEHKLPKDITKAVVKMQDVADADKEKPTQETQSRLGKFYDGMKKLAGFTDDVNKIGGFVAKHQDDIGAVLTSIQNAI